MKLLLLRRLGPNPSQMALFVLSEDGTETRLTYAGYRSGGDFSPDGSRVVYASGGDPAGVYVIEADGGMPERLATGYVPTFSPDGTQIAYFQGGGDWGPQPPSDEQRGSGIRVVLENSLTMGASHVEGLDWSPDGKLVFVRRDGTPVQEFRYGGSGPWNPETPE